MTVLHAWHVDSCQGSIFQYSLWFLFMAMDVASSIIIILAIIWFKYTQAAVLNLSPTIVLGNDFLLLALFSRHGRSVKLDVTVTLDPRLPFLDSVGGIFPGPATTQKVFRVLNGFPSWRGYNDWQFWAMLIMGIRITLIGDCHSGRLAALSPIMLRNSLLTEVKMRHTCTSVLEMWWLTKIMFQLLNTTVTVT